MEGYTVKGIKKPSGQGFVLAIVLAPSFTVVSGRAEMGVVDPWSIYRWSQGMDIIIPSGTDLAIDISQEDFNATLKKPRDLKYSVVSYPARIAG